MTAAEKNAWRQVRARGRARFIVREGLLRRGVPFGLLFGLVELAMAVSRPRSQPWIALIASWIFAGVVFGAVTGVYLWFAREREYAKPTGDDDKMRSLKGGDGE